LAEPTQKIINLGRSRLDDVVLVVKVIAKDDRNEVSRRPKYAEVKLLYHNVIFFSKI